MINIKLKSFLIIILILLLTSAAARAASYTIQTGYFSKENNALNLSQKLTNQGFDTYKYQKNNRYYVFVGEFNSYNPAANSLSKVKKIVPEAYIRKVDFDFTKNRDPQKDENKEQPIKEQETQKNNSKNKTEEKIKESEVDLNKDNKEEIDNNKEVVKQEETNNEKKPKVKKDLDYYKKNEKYDIKTAFLVRNNENSSQFIYPNGEKVKYSSHNYNREIESNNNYYLVFQDNELIDVFNQRDNNKIFYTLKDFGYKNDIILKGWQNSFIIDIPLSNKVIEKEIYLKLNLITSKFIGKLSNIDIIINNQSVKKYNFNSDQNQYSLIFPLDLKKANNLQIKIKAQLRSEQKDYTKSLYENMWIKLKNNSGIGFNLKDKQIYQINNFLGIEAKKINLYYEGKLSRQEFHDYIKLYTYLNKLFRDLPPEIELKLSSEDMEFNNLDNRIRNIVISEGYQKTRLDEFMTLHLSSQDIDFLISDFLNLVNSNFLDVTEYNLKEDINYKLSSYQVDFLKDNRKGWGEINYHYHLPINTFANWPRDFNLHLTGSYFIPFDNPAYLKVYVNGKLIYSEKLKNSSYFKDKLITIEGGELEQFNDLKIQFSQYPAELLDNYSNLMETYINPNSYFTVEGSLYKNISFENLLHKFKGKGQILIDENNSEQLLKATALLYGFLHENDLTNDNFNVNYLSEQSFESKDDNINWYIIMGGNNKFQPNNTKLSQQDGNIVIKNDQQTITEFKMENSLSYIDLINYNDKPVMLLDSIDNIENMEKMLKEVITDGGVNSLKGDLLIYNGENYQTYQLSKETKPSYYQSYYNQLISIFNQYRRYFYLAAVILLVLFLIWIYYKTSHKNTSES